MAAKPVVIQLWANYGYPLIYPACLARRLGLVVKFILRYPALSSVIRQPIQHSISLTNRFSDKPRRENRGEKRNMLHRIGGLVDLGGFGGVLETFLVGNVRRIEHVSDPHFENSHCLLPLSSPPPLLLGAASPAIMLRGKA